MKTQFLFGLDIASHFNLSLDLKLLTFSQPTNLPLEANTCDDCKTVVEIKTYHIKGLRQNDLSVIQMEALSEILEIHGAVISKTQKDTSSISSEQHCIIFSSNVLI